MRKQLRFKLNKIPSKIKGDQKLKIGWCENVGLPELGIKHLKAKVDTGAYSSSLHVSKLERLSNNRVKFVIHTDDKSPVDKVCIAKISRVTPVRSSPHIVHQRVFISTKMKLGPLTKNIDLNLTSRAGLKFRMIIGRSAIKNDFIVDVSKENYLTSKTRRLP